MNELFFGDIYFPGVVIFMFITGLGHGIGWWKLDSDSTPFLLLVTMFWPVFAAVAVICLIISPFVLVPLFVGRGIGAILSSFSRT